MEMDAMRKELEIEKSKSNDLWNKLIESELNMKNLLSWKEEQTEIKVEVMVEEKVDEMNDFQVHNEEDVQVQEEK